MCVEYFDVSDTSGVAGLEKKTANGRQHYDLSRQMSLLRAATTTRIDEELSPANVTAIRGETALLVCTILNIGDKSVSMNSNATKNSRNMKSQSTLLL